MPYKDTPIKKQPERAPVKDTPITEMKLPTHSEDTENFMAEQSAFIQSYLDGSSVVGNFNKALGNTDKEKQLEKDAARKAQSDAEDVVEEFVINPQGDSGSVEEQARAVKMAREQALEQSSDPDKQYAETIVGTEGDMDQTEEQAGKAKMYKVLSDWQEEVSVGDRIMDFGKAMIPFLDSYKGYKLTGQYFDQDEVVKKAIQNFRNLPEEERAKVVPQLKKELQEKVGDVPGVAILNSFLSPFGSEQDQRYDNVDVVFDALDATGIGAMASGIFKGMKASRTITKSMKEVGNTRGAADSATATLVNEDLARATNKDSVTQTGDALPFDTSIEDIGHTNGLSGKVYNNLKEFFNEADQTAEDIIAGNGFLKEGVVNTKKRAELEAAQLKKLKAEQAENIKAEHIDENTTKFTYNTLDEEGNISTEEFTMGLTLNDAGHWDQSTMSLIGEYVGSPTAFAKGTLRDDVDTAQRVDYLNSRMNKQLLELTNKAIKPIGLTPTPKMKASLSKVDKALREGDEWKNVDTGQRGKVFTPDELRSQYDMADNEISTYYRVNRLYNNLFNIRNAEKRKEMEALGFKNINFRINEESVIGKQFDSAGTAGDSLRQGDVNYVYDASNDEVVNVKAASNEWLDEEYAKGRQIVKLDEAYNTGGDRGKVLYSLVDTDDVTELPSQVLNRKEGYVPRIYEDAAYFVKEISDDIVDGNKTFKSRETLRFFDNKKDANKFVDDLVAKAVDSGEMTEKQARSKYVALTDREEEMLASATGEVSHGSGGLYTGARAQDDIMFGLEGTKPSRVNSFESLTRNIGNISRFSSINQWRLGLEQRWINTANEIFKAKGLDERVQSFNELPKTSEAVEEVRFLNKMYNQIRDWQNFPTAEERAFSSSVQKMYDWAAGKNMEKTKKMLGNLRGKDPIASARAGAFHSLLGWFNFSQLWVQAQGASIAMSLGAGKGLTRNMRESMAITSLDHGATSAQRFANSGKIAGLDKADMEAMHKLWEKTGYRDSVLQTADHAAASKGYGLYDAVLKRNADRGLMFYRGGELFNRRLSFTTSLRKHMEDNDISKVSNVTDEDLRSIMDNANNMMLNMTKANRASWQKGALSLPTQFFQVTSKFMETAGGFNRNFSAAERGRMMAGQIGLYGTAGVPLGSAGMNFALESMGMTQEDIENNPGLVKTINDGFWGATTHWVFGADIEMSSRGALMRGISDQIDTWFLEESSITDKLLGAFGSTQTRFWDSFTRKIRPFTSGDWEDVNIENGAELLTAPILNTISTWRNQEKAAYMERLNAVYSKRGRLLDSRDYTWTEEVAQRLGFSQSYTQDIYDLEQITRDNQALRKSITDEAIIRMNEFALEHPNGDYSDEDYESYKRDMQMLMGVLDPDEVLQVNKSIKQAVMSDSRRAQAVKKYVDNMKESTYQDISTWRKTLLGNKVIRLYDTDTGEYVEPEVEE